MNLRTLPLVGAYLAAIVAANLTVAHFGPSWSIYNAFLLIGLDFITRDRLADFWGTKRWPKQVALIAAGGMLSYYLNRHAATIALASCVAFGSAELVEVGIYHALRHLPWAERAPKSAVIPAAIDSLVFPTIAFGSVLWSVSADQFFAKVAGAMLWAWVISRIVPAPGVAPEVA